MRIGALTTIALGVLLACPNPSFADPDTDGDGIPDALDKCVLDSRNAASSCDTDQDGYGNVCDGDFNQRTGHDPQLEHAEVGFRLPEPSARVQIGAAFAALLVLGARKRRSRRSSLG